MRSNDGDGSSTTRKKIKLKNKNAIHLVMPFSLVKCIWWCIPRVHHLAIALAFAYYIAYLTEAFIFCV